MAAQNRAAMIQLKVGLIPFGLCTAISTLQVVCFSAGWEDARIVCIWLWRGAFVLSIWWLTQHSVASLATLFEGTTKPLQRSRQLIARMSIWASGSVLAVTLLFACLPAGLSQMPPVSEFSNWSRLAFHMIIMAVQFGVYPLMLLLIYENALALEGRIPHESLFLNSSPRGASRPAVPGSFPWQTAGVLAVVMLALANVVIPAKPTRDASRVPEPEMMTDEQIAATKNLVNALINQVDFGGGLMSSDVQAEAVHRLVNIGPLAVPQLKEYVRNVTREIQRLDYLQRTLDDVDRERRRQAKNSRSLAIDIIETIESRSKRP